VGITWLEKVRESMSKWEVHQSASYGITLERSREDVLDAARPLPSDDEMVIEELSDDEDRIFLAAIRDH
jgi:hypothetical protein